MRTPVLEVAWKQTSKELLPMTHAPLPTVGLPTAGQYFADFKASQQAIDDANKRDLLGAFGQVAEIGIEQDSQPNKRGAHSLGPMSSNTMLGLAAGTALTSMSTITGVGGPVAAVVVAMMSAGWFAGQWQERAAYNRAVDIYESLQNNSKNAQSMEGLVQGQKKILEESRDPDAPQNMASALGKRAYLIGIMAGGIIAGAVLVPVLPIAAATAVLAGAIGMGACMGGAKGEVQGQEKTDDFLDRMTDRMKSFPGALAARRQSRSDATEGPEIDLTKSKSSFGM